MSFYAEVAAIAHDVLSEFGAPAILTRIGVAVYDPATGVATPPAPLVYTGTGAKFDYEQKDIDGTLIRQGDQRVYLSTVGIVQPQTGDTLTIAGDVFHVVASRPLQPALVAVLHDVQVRGIRSGAAA